MQRSVEIAFVRLRRFQPREIAENLLLAARTQLAFLLEFSRIWVPSLEPRGLDGLYPIGYTTSVIEIRRAGQITTLERDIKTALQLARAL